MLDLKTVQDKFKALRVEHKLLVYALSILLIYVFARALLIITIALILTAGVKMYLVKKKKVEVVKIGSTNKT